MNGLVMENTMTDVLAIYYSSLVLDDYNKISGHFINDKQLFSGLFDSRAAVSAQFRLVTD